MSNKRIRIEGSEDGALTTYAPEQNVGVGNETENPLVPTHMSEIPRLLMIEMQQDSPEDVVNALEALNELLFPGSHGWERKISDAFKFGAHSFVLVVMKKFQYDRYVQEACCECLEVMASSKKLLNKVTILQVGGMEGVVNALNIFPEISGIQLSGVGALCNFFTGVSETFDGDKLLFQLVDELDGVQLVVKTMTNFSDDHRVLGKCCFALAIISEYSELHSHIRTFGGVSAISKVFEKFSDEDVIKKSCTSFMKNMFP